jgi:pimeloyl-ACP methyl ester carboxylesterase
MPQPTANSDKVLEFLCDRRFHRLFTYSSSHTPRHVSYSDYGSTTSSAVVLFFGGLMGGRLAYSPLDALAKKHNIRIIHPDRPGIGATSPVDIEERIPAYLEIIPKLLEHLGIEHVGLAAHSFGTVYAMNVLLRYPHLLHPARPYVAFWAPWVSPEHSGVRHLQAAGLLSGDMIGKFGSLVKWVNGSVVPMLGMSSGVSSAVAGSLKGSTSTSGAADLPRLHTNTGNQQRSERDTRALDLDDPVAVRELRDLIPTYFFSENIDGVGQDTQLCLRKPRSVPWSTPSQPWEDVDDAVHQLRGIITETARASLKARSLVIDVFHAETDGMVGEKGRVWFDGCWQDGRTGASEENAITYTSQIVEASDHDFILDPVFGASERWLERFAESFNSHVVGT